MSWLEGLEHFVRQDEPLAPYCWLRLGGNAEFFAEPTSRGELQEIVRRCHSNEIPIHMIGGGSNLLIRDEGVKGVVIQLAAPEFGAINVAETTIVAGGGAQLSHVVSTAAREGLGGLESLAGIPGTVGGALHGNTGSRTSNVGQRVTEVVVLTRQGEIATRTREDMQFSYRQSSLNELAILEARFSLDQEDAIELTRRMQKKWIIKRASQPTGQIGTLGLFRDPQGMSARELIEQAGLKGTQVGGVRLSDRDPNYVIVEGGTTGDVLELVEKVRKQTAEITGTELETAFEIW